MIKYHNNPRTGPILNFYLFLFPSILRAHFHTMRITFPSDITISCICLSPVFVCICMLCDGSHSQSFTCNFTKTVNSCGLCALSVQEYRTVPPCTCNNIECLLIVIMERKKIIYNPRIRDKRQHTVGPQKTKHIAP